MLRKLHKSLLSMSALAMVVSPVNAGTITSPANGTTITATGNYHYKFLGLFDTYCSETMNGYVDSTGASDKLVFTSGTSSCSGAGGVVYPIVIAPNATSASIEYFEVQTPPTSGGPPPPQCAANGVDFVWASTATESTMTLSAQRTFGLCKLMSMTLAITPKITAI